MTCIVLALARLRPTHVIRVCSPSHAARVALARRVHGARHRPPILTCQGGGREQQCEEGAASHCTARPVQGFIGGAQALCFPFRPVTSNYWRRPYFFTPRARTNTTRQPHTRQRDIMEAAAEAAQAQFSNMEAAMRQQLSQFRANASSEGSLTDDVMGQSPLFDPPACLMAAHTQASDHAQVSACLLGRQASITPSTGASLGSRGCSRSTSLCGCWPLRRES